tara:strand:- start:701 stop:1432 length:732 start_codon:yes stop_codon:yes gene_type:complete
LVEGSRVPYDFYRERNGSLPSLIATTGQLAAIGELRQQSPQETIEVAIADDPRVARIHLINEIFAVGLYKHGDHKEVAGFQIKYSIDEDELDLDDFDDDDEVLSHMIDLYEGPYSVSVFSSTNPDTVLLSARFESDCWCESGYPLAHDITMYGALFDEPSASIEMAADIVELFRIGRLYETGGKIQLTLPKNHLQLDLPSEGNSNTVLIKKGVHFDLEHYSSEHATPCIVGLYEPDEDDEDDY